MTNDPKTPPESPPEAAPESPIERALRMKKAAQAAKSSPSGDNVPRRQSGAAMAAGHSRPATKK